MLKIIYVHESDPILGNILEKQFNEANLESYETESISITDELAEKYDLTEWHTVLYLDKNNDVIHRLEKPFNSAELEENLQYSKGVLSNLQNIKAFYKDGYIVGVDLAKGESI